MYSLLVANIPHDCEEDELQDWIEARGIRVADLKLVSDLVSRTSPAFAQIELTNAGKTEEVARLLDGQSMKGRILRVKPLKSVATSMPAQRMKVSA